MPFMWYDKERGEALNGVIAPAASWRVAIAAAVVAASALAPAQEPAGVPIDAFLRDGFRFTPAQVSAVQRGEAVAVDLPASVAREIAVGGAVRIDAPAERLVALVRDIERLESGKGFLGTKKLSAPPVLEDFAGLTLPAEDVAALKKCRPGRCEVKLGQGAFDRLETVDWSAQDAVARVNAMARQMALEYVQAYRDGGNAELAIYRDTERPQFIANEFAAMVPRTHQLPDPQPALGEYLLEYPKVSRPAGVDEFLYWSLAEFGLKPVVRLNHVVIYPAGTGRTRYAIATKQLYASHYFHTALELRALVDDGAPTGGAHYLVALNVARSDGLTGLFGGMVKAKATKGSREGLRNALAAIKRRCESLP